MEFDNDRKILPPHKTEIFCWIVFALLCPVINAVTFFWFDAIFWPALLISSLITLPVYFFYSRMIIAHLLFNKKYITFAFASIAFFIFVQLILLGINSLILQFPLSLPEQFYLSSSPRVIVRDGLWSLVNIFLATAIAFIKKLFDEKVMMQGLQKDNTMFRLKYLQSQLNPHFLFNTLNSIYSLSLQKSDKAPDVIVKLADIMRYLIYECNEPKILLDKEIEFIKNYIEIEKMRYKADVRFSIEGETKGIMVEPFLFISFIENGFKYAMNDETPNPFVYITIKTEPSKITLNVVNNTNIDLATQAKRINGTSIMNSRSLLEMLYPDSHELNIIQTDIQTPQKSLLRMKNAKERLEIFYPDSHTLDAILNNNSFTVSLVVKPHAA
ncbi:MAG TPA: histidine kinase [Puia sp.]|nr:histidine kinase [Puia sp.]